MMGLLLLLLCSFTQPAQAQRRTVMEGLAASNNAIYVSTKAGSVYVFTAGTAAVAGNAFSVGAATFAVSGGRVGVGTASPTKLLEVNGFGQFNNGGQINNGLLLDDSANALRDSLSIQNTNTGTAAQTRMCVGNNTSGCAGQIIYNGGNFTGANNVMHVINANNGYLLLNETGGNVGVGTSAPGEKLTAAGIIESTTGGFKFPDGSIQTVAGAVITATQTFSGINTFVSTVSFTGSHLSGGGLFRQIVSSTTFGRGCPTATAIPTQTAAITISQGFQLLVATITPIASTSLIEVECDFTYAENGNSSNIGTAALYLDNANNPFAVMGFSLEGGNNVPSNGHVRFITSIGDVSSHNISIRLGSDAANNLCYNTTPTGIGGASMWGGVTFAQLVIREIAQ